MHALPFRPAQPAGERLRFRLAWACFIVCKKRRSVNSRRLICFQSLYTPSTAHGFALWRGAEARRSGATWRLRRSWRVKAPRVRNGKALKPHVPLNGYGSRVRPLGCAKRKESPKDTRAFNIQNVMRCNGRFLSKPLTVDSAETPARQRIPSQNEQQRKQKQPV